MRASSHAEKSESGETGICLCIDQDDSLCTSFTSANSDITKAASLKTKNKCDVATLSPENSTTVGKLRFVLNSSTYHGLCSRPFVMRLIQCVLDPLYICTAYATPKDETLVWDEINACKLVGRTSVKTRHQRAWDSCYTYVCWEDIVTKHDALVEKSSFLAYFSVHRPIVHKSDTKSIGTGNYRHKQGNYVIWLVRKRAVK